MVDQSFDVFLAHNSKDKPLIRKLREELIKRGISPWLDEEEIFVGDRFQDAIQQAIAQIKTAAICIGQQGLGRWQNLELSTFISQCVKRNIPVIPVLLPGVAQIPENLLFLQEFHAVAFSYGMDDEQALGQLVRGIMKHKSMPPPPGSDDRKPAQSATVEKAFASPANPGQLASEFKWYQGNSEYSEYRIIARNCLRITAGGETDYYVEYLPGQSSLTLVKSSPLVSYFAKGDFDAQIKMAFAPFKNHQRAGFGIRAPGSDTYLRIQLTESKKIETCHHIDRVILSSSNYEKEEIFFRIRRFNGKIELFYSLPERLEWNHLVEKRDLGVTPSPEAEIVFFVLSAHNPNKVTAEFSEFKVEYLQSEFAPTLTDKAVSSSVPPALPSTRIHQNPSDLTELTAEQRIGLREALIDAFPNRGELELMVEDHLEETLNLITDGQSTYKLVVRDLVKWAEAQGKVSQLLKGAIAANPGNPKLKKFVGRD